MFWSLMGFIEFAVTLDMQDGFGGVQVSDTDFNETFSYSMLLGVLLFRLYNW